MLAEMTTIPVQLQDRGDGGLRVTSPVVPGLLLSHADREHVWKIFGPALESLLAANHGYVSPKVFYPEISPGAPAPGTAEFHVADFAALTPPQFPAAPS